MTQAATGDGIVLEDFLPYRLSTASNAVSSLIARTYRDRFGLTVPAWRVMAVLAQDGPSTQTHLVARLLMDKETVRHAAAQLVCEGRVARGRRLGLTDEGRRVHGEIAPLAMAYEAALIAGLAPGEVMVLKRLLGRVQAAAEALAGDAELPVRLAG